MDKIFTLLTAGFGLMISVNALVSKSDLEQVFLTHEQKIKMKYYRVIGLSVSLGIIVADLYFLWSILIQGKTFYTVNWNEIIGLGITWFILGLLSINFISSMVVSLFARYHFKYKIDFPDLGEVYIHESGYVYMFKRSKF